MVSEGDFNFLGTGLPQYEEGNFNKISFNFTYTIFLHALNFTIIGIISFLTF